MSIIVIAATDKNGIIGNSFLNTMPWSCKEELKHFKRATLNNVIVMGRTTAEEVGALPNRDCVVLSRDPDYKLASFRTLTEEEFLNETDRTPDVWYYVAGGARVYSSLMQYATTFIISTMKFEVRGDVFMPELPTNLRLYNIEEYDEFTVNYYVAV